MSASTSDNRIVKRLAELAAHGEKALVVYLTAGDPSLDESVELCLEVARAGADINELGVPWSDPSADGPVIQRAMERALSTGGAGIGAFGKTLDVVRRLRETSQVPVVLFGYFNPLLQRGLRRAVDECKSAGVDGLLVVDLPLDEADELGPLLTDAGLCRIPLLAPTTTLERARMILSHATGFAYYVALTGVTGAGHLDASAVGARLDALRPLSPVPLAVGFGISDAAGARAVAPSADAVVVGSALIAAVERASGPVARRHAAAALVTQLKEAIASTTPAASAQTDL